MAKKTEKKGALYPKGFMAASINCGIKKDKNDLTLLVCPGGATVAGTFTKNLCCAAPVELCKEHLKGGVCRAIIINSGNANAATGERGYEDALATCCKLSETLGCPAEEVFVSSTGCIGKFLPLDKILNGIPQIVLKLEDSPDSEDAAALGILTTDTVKKQAKREISLSKGKVRIGGMCKGSGMIAPNMATMLAYVTTDAVVSQEILQELFSKAVKASFNHVSVDGDTSTNDSAFLLASGMSGVPVKTKKDRSLFYEALEEVCVELAKDIARDGEGATKFVEVTVEGAKNDEDAEVIAKTIANSPLVKTSICGGDPNWGRILAAAGRAGVPYDQYGVDLYMGDLCAAKGGMNAGTPREELAKVYRQKEVKVRLVIGKGKGRFTAWTCDMTHGYIDINVDYT
ncbi:bifunctional glutamate N-acetyltransferase/amino-acid acetyltransferase ArgJ [bacterium]|nr:bifunctional glutamate N-acetyltransferase/amino-acid acetyltransferase ArgJ [bacterium]